MHPMPFGKVPGLWSIEGMPSAAKEKILVALGQLDSLSSSPPWSEGDQPPKTNEWIPKMMGLGKGGSY